MTHPTVSVVIPVYNSADTLRQALERLHGSSEPADEILVVDDGSSDGSAQVARDAGVRLLETGGRKGPACARNIGAKQATGKVIFFLDADVVVQPDTIERARRSFAEDPELDALIGSYDDEPGSKDFLSQYRNLMHHFVHQRAQRDACTFWSGCGAIRRSVFMEHGGFDETYERPAIEDIELGYRLFQANRKMILDRDLQVKHLKQWTFWGLIRCDVLDRGIPWTELILRDKRMPNDLNLQLSQRVSVALAFVLMTLAAVGTIYWGGYFLTPLFVLLFLALGRFWGEAVSHRDSRRGLLITAFLVAAISIMSAAHDMTGMIPPLVLSYGLLIAHHRYEFVGKKRRSYTRITLGLLFFTAVFLTIFYLPSNFLMYSVLMVALVMVALNTQFYLFLAARKHKLFAVAAIPFHLLYHLYSGFSFIAGLVRHTFSKHGVRRGASEPAGTPVDR